MQKTYRQQQKQNFYCRLWFSFRGLSSNDNDDEAGNSQQSAQPRTAVEYELDWFSNELDEIMNAKA